jgi:hypothetical protein
MSDEERYSPELTSALAQLVDEVVPPWLVVKIIEHFLQHPDSLQHKVSNCLLCIGESKRTLVG